MIIVSLIYIFFRRFLFENAFLWVEVFLSVDNVPEITKAIKSVLKDDYNYNSTVSP